MDKDVDKHGQWEQTWQQVFEGTELPAPGRNWRGVERHLLNAQLQKYKKRAFWYQQLAAAAIVLLVLVGGYNLYVAAPVPTNPQDLALTNNEAAFFEKTPMPSQAQVADSETSYTQPTLKNTNPYLFNSIEAGASALKNNQASSNKREGESSPGSLMNNNLLTGAKVNYSHILESIVLRKLVTSPALSSALAEVSSRTDPKQPEKTKKAKSNKAWVGISLAGNFFNPNYSTSSSSALNNIRTPVAGKGGQQLVYTANIESWNSNQSALPALNLQLDALFQIKSRWYLATSLGYGSFRSESKMGLYTEDNGQLFPLHYANFEFSKLETARENSRSAQPIDAVNQFNFLQVPLKLSYMVLDGKFGVAPLVGINTQFFLNGRLAPEKNSGLEDYQIDNKSSSPFRNFYFSALAGAQLFLHTNNGTVITLEPSFQQAITPFSRNSYLFSSEPSNLGVSLGIRKRIK